MIVHVPDCFRGDVVTQSPEELEQLRLDVGMLLPSGKDHDEIVRRMIDAGYSESFGHWYVPLVLQHNRDVKLYVPELTEREHSQVIEEERRVASRIWWKFKIEGVCVLKLKNKTRGFPGRSTRHGEVYTG
jgi:hypothetical protein